MQICPTLEGRPVRTRYILAGVIGLSLLGCQGAKNGPAYASDRATLDVQIRELRQINSAISETLLAARQAFSQATSAQVGPVVSARAEHLKRLIKDGKCEQTASGAESRLDHPWRMQWEVGSSECPTLISEYSEFKQDQRKWFYTRTIQNKTTDFQALSGFDLVRARGTMAVQKNKEVKGNIKYDLFSIARIGTVQADVSGSTINADQGSVKVRIVTLNTDAVGMVEWSGRYLKYFLNDGEIEMRDFNEMFSSFQPLEIMDRMREMR